VELILLLLNAFKSENLGPKQVAYDFFYSFVSVGVHTESNANNMSGLFL
jgi:hypothetical protein